jgi:signal transduction histidine kinase
MKTGCALRSRVTPEQSERGLPVQRPPLTELDGPLTHLIQERNQAQLALSKAELNLEQFMAACRVITHEASGALVDRLALPAEVQAWLKRIESRAAEHSTRLVQRAD